MYAKKSLTLHIDLQGKFKAKKDRPKIQAE